MDDLQTPGPKLPRIFWCPTGSFSSLPVHAAGHYGGTDPGPKISDHVVSSYIPMMSALAPRPPGDMDAATSCQVLMLAVPQPSTDGQARLRCVGEEMDVIRRLTSSSPSVDLQESDGTVDEVLTRMQTSDWVHFACHGTQDRKNPLDSGLLLAHGRRLKVSDIVRLSRPQHGGLAFLSACQTATGDEQLSDEAIHIAAGMLLAGYRGVIATMWTIMDSDAPTVTEEVYKRLFAHDEVRLDGGEAAEALHYAIERLRDGSRAPFLSWVPFIHVGL